MYTNNLKKELGSHHCTKTYIKNNEIYNFGKGFLRYHYTNFVCEMRWIIGEGFLKYAFSPLQENSCHRGS